MDHRNAGRMLAALAERIAKLETIVGSTIDIAVIKRIINADLDDRAKIEILRRIIAETRPIH
jgi:hypothetical protein